MGKDEGREAMKAGRIRNNHKKSKWRAWPKSYSWAAVTILLREGSGDSSLFCGSLT
jgi:hypothetical protein